MNPHVQSARKKKETSGGTGRAGRHASQRGGPRARWGTHDAMPEEREKQPRLQPTLVEGLQKLE